MTKAAIGEYNLLFRNSFDTIVGDLLGTGKQTGIMEVCSVAGLNEGAAFKAGSPKNRTPAAAVQHALKKAGWKGSFSGESDWLIWDPRVWAVRGRALVKVISPSAEDLGMHFPYSPARKLVSRRLEHRGDGTLSRFYVTHLVQGYAAPDGKFGDAFEAYKDRAAKAGVRNIDRIVRARLASEENVDFDHLLGDMNSRQSNRQAPFYPARVWTGADGVWVPDTLPGSIDWMLHSKRAKRHGLEVVKRDTLGHEDGLNSDHRAGVKIVRW